MAGPQIACFASTKVQICTLCTFVLASPYCASTKVQRVQMAGHQFACFAITTVQIATSV
jgi:hypothetical protein